MKEARNPITFEEFRHLIARELHVEETLVVRDASFVDDLFADSIRLVEMMLRLKEEGITIPMEEAWNVRTVGDAYRVYSSHVDNNDTIKKPPTGTS
ncbi:MAG: acyl carrier protein [Spirochaetia bacterium]